MRNECLRLIEGRKIVQMSRTPGKSLPPSFYESLEMYEVSHVVKGETVTEVLPKEEARTLFRKLAKVTDTASIRPEVFKTEYRPYMADLFKQDASEIHISGYEVEA